MKPEAPDGLIDSAQRWETLTPWERAELGRSLRRLGWTYGEIMEIVPVPKGTLAGWCSGVRLNPEQVAAIKIRVSARKGVPVDTQWRRRQEIERIQAEARTRVADLMREPLWLAGTILYWAEGSKTKRMLVLANGDARVLRLFMQWCRSYHAPVAGFRAALNLHADNDEPVARRWWASTLGLTLDDFTKTYIKPDGTPHRKNRLPVGVCRLTLRKSADGVDRTMAWIDEMASRLAPPSGGNLPRGSLAQSGRASDS